jgi:hypothetical protein
MMRLPLPTLKFWRQPLLRLLAINLAGGIVVAIIAVGGLLLVSLRICGGSFSKTNRRGSRCCSCCSDLRSPSAAHPWARPSWALAATKTADEVASVCKALPPPLYSGRSRLSCLATCPITSMR